VVLIDTPWTSDQTRRLVIWAEEELQAPVTHVVVTHFHPDCMGGIAIAHERQIPTYGSVRTAELAAAEGQPPPRTLFESVKTLKVGDETLELFAPGAGHAPDNIVVWLAERRVLFGGCLIRSAAARRLGHLGVADLERWPATLDRVQQRYGEPALIVPGHGSPGGVELIDKTRRLLAEAN
jgi:metallo-beta-lactamase class B